MQAEAAFFHDALVTQRNFLVELAGKSEFLGIVKIKLAGLHGAVRSAEAATCTALIHHRRKSIGRMVCRPRRAHAFARSLTAMGAHKRRTATHIDPVHKATAGRIVFGHQRHVIFLVASKNTFAATIAKVQVYRHPETVQRRGSRNTQGTRTRDLHQIQLLFRLRNRKLYLVLELLKRRAIAQPRHLVERQLAAAIQQSHHRHQRATLDEFATIHTHKIPSRLNGGKRHNKSPPV